MELRSPPRSLLNRHTLRLLLSVSALLSIGSGALLVLEVVGGFVPDDTGKVHEIDKKAKLEALADILDELGTKQCAIWCAFKAEVAFLAFWLTKYYGPIAAITGDTKTSDRTAAVEAFRVGEARYFLGTSAAGEGINGLQVADTEVFYSRNWNLKDYLQMQDRLHRHGQTSRVTVINLVAQGTVDERVADALEKKKSLQELMLTRPEDLF